MKKIMLTVGALVLVLVVGAVIAVMTFNVDHYRDDITRVLTEKTGRSIKLSGPIKLDLTLAGATLDLADVVIGNPSWASRPDMAKIGHFGLGVAILPLMDGHLLVKQVVLENADILMETTSNNRHNWDMPAGQAGAAVTPVSAPAATTPAISASTTEAAAGKKIDLHIDSVTVSKSRIGMRGADGKVTEASIDDLKLEQASDTKLGFKGSFNGTPIDLTLTTNGDELASEKVRPIKLDLNVDKLNLKAAGTASLGTKQAMLQTYELSAGSSTIKGQLAAAWGGARPSVTGTVTSDKLTLADFKSGSSATGSAAGDAPATAAPARLFSETPLALSGMKAADATLDINIVALDMGSSKLDHVVTHLVLRNGDLEIAPLAAELGSGKITGQVHLGANVSPAKLGLTFKGDGINMSDLLHLGSLESFISGKINMDMNLASTGNSPHALASNLDGAINLIGAGGDIITRTSDRVTSGIEALLSGGAGGGEQNLNCMVARFTALNGLVRDNGILLDTGAATMMGSGTIDLRGETLDLTFRGRPKAVNTAGLLPAAHVGGTLLHPGFGMDASSVVQNVAGLLMGNAAAADPVPTVVVAQGQNACLNALNNPKPAATTTATTATQGVVQKLGGRAGTLLKGFLGQ